MIRQDAAFTCRYRAPGSAPQGPIRYAIGQTTLGMVLAGKTELGICAILLGADRDALRAELATAFPDATLQAIRDRCNLSWPPSPPISTTATPMRRWRWTWAAPPSSSRCGRRSPPSRPARPAATASWRASSARPTPRAPWPAPAPPTCWPWPFPAIAWCGAMARYPAIAGASNASARCSPASAADDAGNLRHGAGPGPPRLGSHRARARRAAMRGCPACWTRAMRGSGCRIRFAGRLSQPYRDGAPRLRAGRVQVFSYPLPPLLQRCARRCIRAWRPSPTAGTNCSAIRNGFPPRTTRSWRNAMRPARSGPRRSSCNMGQATTTACTRTCTASGSFPCRWPSCCRGPAGTSAAANSS